MHSRLVRSVAEPSHKRVSQRRTLWLYQRSTKRKGSGLIAPAIWGIITSRRSFLRIPTRICHIDPTVTNSFVVEASNQNMPIIFYLSNAHGIRNSAIIASISEPYLIIGTEKQEVEKTSPPGRQNLSLARLDLFLHQSSTIVDLPTEISQEQSPLGRDTCRNRTWVKQGRDVIEEISKGSGLRSQKYAAPHQILVKH